MMTIHPGKSPPVVFVAQLGTGGASWKPVIDLLTTAPTAITYDRPGTGDAPPRPAPNPPLPYSSFAEELAALLEQHRITEPVVLVSHSVGSLIARVFADRHPGQVCGMVHVDGSIPRLNLWPIGPLEEPLDGEGQDATSFDSVAGEIEILEAATPAVPTAVVTRSPGRWPQGYAGAEPLWTAYQRQLATLSHAPLVVAADAGHQIPADAPRLVAYAVDVIVAAVRAGRPWRPDPAELAAVGGTLDPAVRPPGDDADHRPPA